MPGFAFEAIIKAVIIYSFVRSTLCGNNDVKKIYDVRVTNSYFAKVWGAGAGPSLHNFFSDHPKTSIIYRGLKGAV